MTTTALTPPHAMTAIPVAADSVLIKRFAEITLDDLPTVGGKNASLGELIHALQGEGVPVPDGFAITADGFRYALRESGVDRVIRETL
ncbi:MAG: PEP/pyruvate-binding domain-containing protein, partial [Gemmatimonadaceae bacterium]